MVRGYENNGKSSVISQHSGGMGYRPLTERAKSSSPKVTFSSTPRNQPVNQVPVQHFPPTVQYNQPILRPVRSHSLSMDNRRFVRVNEQSSNLVYRNSEEVQSGRVLVQEQSRGS